MTSKSEAEHPILNNLKHNLCKLVINWDAKLSTSACNTILTIQDRTLMYFYVRDRNQKGSSAELQALRKEGP